MNPNDRLVLIIGAIVGIAGIVAGAVLGATSLGGMCSSLGGVLLGASAFLLWRYRQ